MTIDERINILKLLSEKTIIGILLLYDPDEAAFLVSSIWTEEKRYSIIQELNLDSKISILGAMSTQEKT